MVEHFVKVL